MAWFSGDNRATLILNRNGLEILFDGQRKIFEFPLIVVSNCVVVNPDGLNELVQGYLEINSIPHNLKTVLFLSPDLIYRKTLKGEMTLEEENEAFFEIVPFKQSEMELLIVKENEKNVFYATPRDYYLQVIKVLKRWGIEVYGVYPLEKFVGENRPIEKLFELATKSVDQTMLNEMCFHY